MQGLTVVVSGCVFIFCLAAPGALFASPGVEPETEGSGLEAAGGAADDATNEVAAVQPGEAGAGDGAAAAATRTVAMGDGNRFVPSRIKIAVGDTVQWKNESDVAHDAIGERNSFETPIIDGGESSEHSFDEAGKYPYFCSIHQGMTGRIQVGSSGGDGGNGKGGGGGSGSDDSSSGTGGTSSPGSSTGSSGSTGGSSSGSSGTSGFGSTGSTGTTGSTGSGSGLPATGLELVWLGLFGYGLVAAGALARLGALGR